MTLWVWSNNEITDIYKSVYFYYMITIMHSLYEQVHAYPSKIIMSWATWQKCICTDLKFLPNLESTKNCSTCISKQHLIQWWYEVRSEAETLSHLSFKLAWVCSVLVQYNFLQLLYNFFYISGFLYKILKLIIKSLWLLLIIIDDKFFIFMMN